MNIKIVGTGSYVPEKILTNDDLSKIVNTSDEWIVTRTGIRERRIAAPDESSSSMGYIACRRALDMAGVDPGNLDAIIVATSTPDYVFPNTACLIQRSFGASRAFCTDISSACTGYVSALQLGYSIMLGNQDFRTVLICGAEKLSAITDWTDRNTCVLFGDGAGAAVLVATGDGNEHCLLASDIHADGNSSDILRLPAGGSRNPASHGTIDAHMHFIHMAGRETFKMAVNAMTDAALAVLAKAGMTFDDVKMVIPHQANIRIIDAVSRRLGLPEGKVYINIDRYGNTSAASIGICLDEAVRSGAVRHGDVVLMASFGSGLTWGALLIRL